MKRFASVMFLSCLIMLAGCNSISKYDDEDVAAIVRGEEITVGELRFLYSDDKVSDYLDGTIKAKLAEQEVKRMNLDVSEKLQEIQASIDSIEYFYPPEDDNSKTAKDTRRFYESQAKKLGMEPKEFFKKHAAANQETGVYLQAYVDSVLGEPTVDDKDFDMEDFNKKANAALDELVKEHKDEIEKFIK
ncbi:SurA N-terminal domain-containing protein [Sporosarcina luteola]|uniref:SurA N-terminal domain-containing protein n=1 Tax=Sporosarcina luteola TaxID=582850 RepID=UPI00203A73B2|nr:SurA N-terminal domain-containing protein [Sporosarcina luteola]MCM3710212.1 SurA N-terminal domain-containing protein [Sporosarcina luteola]